MIQEKKKQTKHTSIGLWDEPNIVFEDVSEPHNSSICHINTIHTGMHTAAVSATAAAAASATVKTDELSTLEYPTRRYSLVLATIRLFRCRSVRLA